MNNLTLGSLFDGSGGFPLAGIIANIQPIWASEIEPLPIRVTKKRIPQMKHYGDISNIDGGKIEPVDIITFGSPSQDLSLAGRRDGLDGARSSLFFEAIRVIKEMRCATNGKYPRWIVWENVPGALSSSKGQDFRTVLEEICKIKDETVSVPMPEKWTGAGEIVGKDYSVAYRILDAQYFGVPQRRRRIFLVADFGGQSAGKVLFESEGLFGDFTKERGSWQRTATDAQESITKTGTVCLNDQGGNRMDVTDDVTCTLRAQAHHPPCVMESAGFCTEHSAKSRSIGYGEEQSPTLRAGVVPATITKSQNSEQYVFENHSQDTRYKGPIDVAQTVVATYGKGGNNQPFVVSEDTTKVYGICSNDSNSMKSNNPHSGIYEADTARTIDANGGNPGCNQGGMAVVSVQGSVIGRKDENGPNGSGVNEDVSFTLNTVDHHAVAYGIDRAAFNQGKNAQYDFTISKENQPTIVAKGPSAVMAATYSSSKASFFTRAEKEVANTLCATDYKDAPIVNDTNSEMEYIVRRLTPLECCRLQGFPDYWCDGLESENPTDAEIYEWAEIFETHRKAIGKSTKPKSRNQIRKWLQNTCSDSALYTMWGNGVALPCVFYVLYGIANVN